MPAAIVSIADAVVTALTAGTFSQSFTPTRVAVPSVKLSDIGTLKVHIRGARERVTLLTRGGVKDVDYDIDIAIRKKITNTATTTEHDALVALTEEIADFFFTNGLTGRSERLMDVSTDENGNLLWVVDDVENHRAFVSVLTLTFKGTR